MPTTAGARLYAAAVRMLDVSDEIQSIIAEMRTGKSGAVRVGAATGALYYISSTLQSLRKDYADLDINLKVATSEDISHAAAENQVDLAILWLPEASQGLSTCRLMRAPYAMIVSPRHPLAKCKIVQPETLDGAKFIVAVKGSGSHALFIEEVLRRLRVKASIGMEFNHTEAIKRAVEADLGVGVVPVKSIERELEEGRLVSVRVRGMKLSRELGLAYHAWKLEEPSVKLVSDVLIRRLRPPPRVRA